MGNLIQTMVGHDYSLVDDRCLLHDGCIVDLGCHSWDWSEFFINKKRVIGVDPYEKQIDGTEIFNGLIYDYNGKVNFGNNGWASNIFDGGNDEFEVITWKKLCSLFNIDKISILKMNIEGSEYGIIRSLDSEDFSKIDQIAISFHDWLRGEWSKDTQECIEILTNNGFTVSPIYSPLGWYLATKNV
jgi:FkbM family methyltransferase